MTSTEPQMSAMLSRQYSERERERRTHRAAPPLGRGRRGAPQTRLPFRLSLVVALRVPGSLQVYEPWHLATFLALFATPAAQCFSQLLLPPGPTVWTDDDLDWWNPWYMLLAGIFWIVVFTIAFPNPHRGNVSAS